MLVQQSRESPDRPKNCADCCIKFNYRCESAFCALGVGVCRLVFHKDFTFHFLVHPEVNAPGEILISYRDIELEKGF